MQTFKNLSLKWKIISLSSMLILLTIVIAVFQKYVNSDTTSVEQAYQLKIDMVSAINYGNSFLATKNPVWVDSAKKNLTDYREIIANISGSHQKTLSDYADVFEKHFSSAVKQTKKMGLNKNSGDIGRLNKAADNIESILMKTKKLNLLVEMLNTRKSEKNFMLTSENRDSNMYKNDIYSLINHIRSSNLSAQQKAKVISSINLYSENFNDYVKVKNIQMADTAKLKETEKSIEADVNKYIAEELSLASFWKGTSNIVLIFGILFGIFLSLYLAKIISTPIKKLTEAINNYIKGDEEINIEADSKDEAGILINNFNRMIKKIKNAEAELLSEKASVEKKVEEAVEEAEKGREYLEKNVNKLLSEMNKFAKGDLTVKVKKEKDDTIGKLFDGFNDVAKNMRNLINHVIEAVQATASASAEISSSAEQMAAGAQEQSAQTTEVAGAVEQMTATIVETTKNAGIGAELTKESSDLALEGGGKVSAATEGMKKIASVVKITSDSVNDLSTSTNKISNIIQVIDEIADQTNLLALNAAIEAARAGEEGRGFAVVADEVRKLAERTSKATKEITGMIKQIQQNMSGVIKQTDQAMKETEKGINLANQAAEELEKIIETSKKVSDTVDQVASASEEQSATAEQISKNIEQISNVTNESASGVQQIAKAAEDLNRLTENLQQIIEKFKVNRASNENDYNDFSSNLMVNSNGEVI